jgi:hypothetical protein
MKKLIVGFLLLTSVFCFAQPNPQPSVDTTHKTTTTTVITTITTKVDTAKKIVVKTAPIQTLDVTRSYFSKEGVCIPQKTNHIPIEAYPEDYISVATDTNGINLAEINIDTFRLWMNGICYNNIKPLFIDRKNSALIFKLGFDTSKTSPWQMFYAYPNYWTFHHEVTVNLGTLKQEFKGNTKANTACTKMRLNTTVLWMAAVGYFLLAVILVLIVIFGSGIIRDISLYAQNDVRIAYKKNDPTDKEKGVINVRDLPYSLSRFQFLFWLLIIFASIIHIWCITDSLTNPTGTVLLLLGISGGTFYVGRLIDKKQVDPTSVVPVKTATECVTEFVDKNLRTKGFMRDVLNDGKGISLHRLQLVMFTIFLGIYFIWEVVYGLKLPQFSDTMMTLMGISSGTYAGMKTSED